jgi:hypothetical protein
VKFQREASALAAIAREVDDPPLHRACDRLAEIAVEADEVDGRFRAQMDQVKALLDQRTGRR